MLFVTYVYDLWDLASTSSVDTSQRFLDEEEKKSQVIWVRVTMKEEDLKGLISGMKHLASVLDREVFWDAFVLVLIMGRMI
jgi:hypothetical protein